jgi:hypothetical protein
MMGGCNSWAQRPCGGIPGPNGLVVVFLGPTSLCWYSWAQRPGCDIPGPKGLEHGCVPQPNSMMMFLHIPGPS